MENFESAFSDVIKKEYEKLKVLFPSCWIGYNSVTDEYFVSIIPFSFTNSLMIKKVK